MRNLCALARSNSNARKNCSKISESASNHMVFCLELKQEHVNPSNAGATFVQSTRTQRFANHLNPVMLVFLESSRWVLLDEYHVPGFQSFSHVYSLNNFVLAKVATSNFSTWVNGLLPSSYCCDCDCCYYCCYFRLFLWPPCSTCWPPVVLSTSL